jgi:hypothetical protein
LGAVDPLAFPGGRDISTGESAANELDGLGGRRPVELSDIVKPRGSGPVFGEDAPAKRIELNLPSYPVANTGGVEGPAYPELKAADTGEQTSDRDHHVPAACLLSQSEQTPQDPASPWPQCRQISTSDIVA